jgi:hypothetical protein
MTVMTVVRPSRQVLVPMQRACANFLAMIGMADTDVAVK